MVRTLATRADEDRRTTGCPVDGLTRPNGATCHDVHVPARFVPLADVAETLSVSAAQAYALVRSGELPAIQVGGRGQWRVEISELEAYIERQYEETRRHAQSRETSRPTTS